MRQINKTQKNAIVVYKESTLVLGEPNISMKIYKFKETANNHFQY